MLFERRLRDGLRNGTITVAFRRWKRRQASAGGRYRTGDGGIAEVTALSVVEEIGEDDARAAGYPGVAELLADLRGEGAIYRLELRLVDEPDPREELANDERVDVAEIDRRLARMGAWARPTLELIARRPGVRAGDLAPEVGLDKDRFKVGVRRLKELGLTLSLETGYRISPRGHAYLAATKEHPSETA
ncbi:hypothetical protein [Spongiactinospora sp. TRM90649]|uniref:hypothetical protein n=1 Tax=Spongiactinospora sp. TRM90649 TaxID=3031114 RepID=UPI0023F660FA|nr:hypothetical protein [Spongiactinospora sp. TRM90649]MDF5751590.1 hypothetical protein [Spongiactinospora sp. TRM90649]